jgi:hypothetical protein
MSLKNNGNHPSHNTALEPASSSRHLSSADYYEERAEWDEETLNLRDYLDVIILRRWLII